MADDNDTGQEQEQQEAEPRYVRLKREDIKALEEAAAKAKDVENVQRELAMVKAGINTESALGKMFFKSYEGDLTKEALTAAAQEIGLLEVVQQNPEVTAEEKKGTQERQQVANGASPPDHNPKHPKDEALENANRVIDEGGTYEQAGAGYISTLVQRYADGDERAVVQKKR